MQGTLASLIMMIQYRNVQNICCIYMYIKIWAHSVMLVLFLHVHSLLWLSMVLFCMFSVIIIVLALPYQNES